MENAEDQRMLDRLVDTEATRCLLRDCHATLLRATEGQKTPASNAAPETTEQVLKHVQQGGALWLQPGSLGIAIATLAPGKGCMAGDQLHDATCEQPLLVTTDKSGERHVYFKADPAKPIQRAIWLHGRIIERQGWVHLDNSATLVEAIASYGPRARPADLRHLPGYRTVA